MKFTNKYSRLTVALALLAPFASAHAGLSVTPFGGYHYAESAEKEQLKEMQYAKKNGQLAGVSLGIDINPSMAIELEYAQSDNDVAKRSANTPVPSKFKQNNASINFLVNSDLITQNYDGFFKPYVLAGVGLGSYDVVNGSQSITDEDGVVGNLGLGTFLRFTDYVSLRGELRGLYNFDRSWFEALALAGLQVTFGGHSKPVIPEPPMPDVEAEIEPIIIKQQPKDTDRDGVIDQRDRCPNTPPNTAVDANGCAKKKVKETLKMELRVFFDVNKSFIKAQYRPEVAKVARTMNQYKNTTALIEGHTSKTGPRRLNERLSLARANAVKGMLANKYGINPARMQTKGYAWDRPVAPNNTAEGRALNRRVYAVISGTK